MKKNDTKKKYTKPGQHVLLLVMFALILSGSIFLLYQYEKTPKDYRSLSAYFFHLKDWALAHKPQHSIKAKPIIASRENTEPPVHFEFYTTLPNMQIATKNVVPHVIAEKNNNQVALVTPKINTKVVNANELEQELLSQIKSESYVIQLGFFHKAAAAEQYRHSLWRVGLMQNMLRVVAEKDGYRVQLGPFTNKIQARIAKSRLQKKGINSSIHIVTNSSHLSVTGKG